MKRPKFLDLKVYTNKKTGQKSIVLPKKHKRKIPNKVLVKIWWNE